MEYAGPKNVANFRLPDVHVWDVRKSRSLKRPGILDQHMRYAAARNYVVDSLIGYHNGDLEQDEVFKSCLRDSRDFISKELGYTSTAPAYHRPKTDIYNASYNLDEDSIIATPPQNANEFFHRTMLTGNLIHEMAHESGEARRMYILSELHESNGMHHDIHWTLGMQTLKLSKEEPAAQTGNFFEEAFAESVAAKWREQTIPGYLEDKITLWETSYGVNLPMKYHDCDRDPTKNDSFTTIARYPGIAAYAMELISQYTGTDLYEVMKLARKRETEAEYKRLFIRTINSVKPGLYKALRDLRYDETTGDFERGLEMIKTAITEHQAARQKVII